MRLLVINFVFQVLASRICSGDVILREGEITTVNLTQTTTRVLNYMDRSKLDVKYVILEIHSQVINVTLSWDFDFKHDATVYGRDVGVITLQSGASGEKYWFVKADGLQAITTLMLVKYLLHNDPIPGGCNQILNLENDPNLLLSYTNYWTSVRYQWANTASQSECESSLDQKLLHYDVYVYFMKSASLGENYYMDSMKKMMRVNNIIKNGRKILSMTNDRKTKSNFTVSSVNGQGAIYGVVVKQPSLGTVASYVSMVSYGCSLRNQTCDVGIDKSEYVIGALCGLVGLGLCFFGHKFLKTELFVFGFLSWSVVSFLLFSKYTTFNEPVILLVISCLIGVLGGGVAVMFWWYFGIPVISILFVGFLGGYIFSSIIFFTPFGNMDIWQTELNYWMAFLCGLLVYPLVLLCFTKTLNILTSAFVGSFLISIFIDILLHTILKLIILNNFNHAIIADYVKVKVIAPFELNDVIMGSTWFILLVVGMVFQFIQNKGQAPFPPCPRSLRKRRLEQERNRLRAMNQYDNERQPLLFERPPSYTTTPKQELQQPT